ncbi:SPOR domain-containing protein [Sphingomonas sp.]|uniref:SPOR domain-containing protein n=1 Tax=Sphingomonas sp. TaxID=28214 RepID=UPI003B00B9B1
MPLPRALALALILTPLPALAQGPVLPVGMSDADGLAEQVRRLGANPLDLEALLAAGELSIRLEDYSAAGAFFARAQKIDPRSGRAKAGEGAILVHAERPAESLRYFAQAEQFGFAPARFAAERGLAYDLLGDPGRAQRDYRAALQSRDDAETRRRYALSLAIAGRQAQALDQLAPLIRQNDRAAWRTRAFVLAMGGNATEALKIAETMMPPGAAASLRQFFTELPGLPPVDRAFAVHFGEVRPTPQRLADARFAPRDAPLALEPLPRPVQVASVQPLDSRRDRRDRKRRGETQVAALVPVPQPVSQPQLQPPAYQVPINDRPLTGGELASLAAAGNRASSRRTGRGPATTMASRPLSPTQQANLAGAGSGASATFAVPTRAPIVANVVPARVPLASVPPASVPGASVVLPAAARVSAPVAPSVTPTPAPIIASVMAAPVRTAPLRTPSRPLTSDPTQGRAPLIVALPAASRPRSAVSGVATPAAVTAPAVVASASGAPVPPATVAATPTSTLAAATAPAPTPGFITALTPATSGIDDAPSTVVEPIPTPPGRTELAAVAVTTEPLSASVTPLASSSNEAIPTPAPPAIAMSTPPAPLLVAPLTNARLPMRRGRSQTDAVLARIVAGLSIPASELDVGAARTTPGQATPTAAERRAAERRAAADRKAIADRKAAADAKAQAARDAAREAAEARRVARSEPARIWVQVAGGANEAGLALAWSTMRGRAPQQLTGRQAWTTPLRATNRVLTGPFRTDAEARALVNQLGKAGVPAFAFTSEAGQKVTRLPTR